jgi:hypothetical protein
MRSLRKYLACIGFEQGSVLHDFFGLGKAPGTQTLSIQQQMERLRRSAVVHLNFVRVGYDTLGPSQREVAERKIDLAAHRIRQIFDQVSLGIGRILNFELSSADAPGYQDIGDDGEAEDLADRFSVDNDALDFAWVLTYAGDRVGSSPKPPGSCDKDDKGAGIVCSIEASFELTATAAAHEVGHYLGLDHSDDSTNLMSHSGERGLTASQGECVRSHCLVTECPDVQEN